MKRTLVALMVGVIIGSLLTGLAALSSAVASGSDESVQGQAIAAGTAPAATPTVVVVVEPNPEIVNAPPAPHPEGKDPVLGGGHWGTRSSKVSGARGHAVTSDLHTSVEDYENNLLANQQADELLDIFSDSRGVHRLISRYGGDPDDARYYVKTISANEDRAGSSTPWVTATLRADFASPEGKRGLEMQVYRAKTIRGLLDNTPFVASTQVSYLDGTDKLMTDDGYHPPGDSGVSSDGLQTIQFKN